MQENDTSRVIRKLTLLGSSLNAVIDAGQHVQVRYDVIMEHIKQRSIFQYLEANFADVANWGLSSCSEEDKWHLLGEWQSMRNAVDADRKFGVKNNGISLLVAYVLQGIQQRSYDDIPWPYPEPFE